MLKEVLGVQLSMGAWYELWLERCRDGLHAVMCALIVTCFINWFSGKCSLVVVHPYTTCFCTFWQSAFSVTYFWAFFGRWGQLCRCKCV